MKTFTILRVALFTAVLKGCGLNLNQYQYKKRGLKAIQKVLILAILPLMISCSNVFISNPQPVDSKNIYSFPKAYRGIWTCETDTVIAEKDYFKYIQSSERFVSKLEVDTSSSYVLKDNKIYIIDTTDGKLRGGFPFKLENDTLYYHGSEINEITLGKKAFLRKVKKNYILNVKQENGWWELILIRKNKNGNIIAAGLDIHNLEKYTNYKNIYTFKEDEYSRTDYIEATWTKKELLEIINKGAFSDIIFNLKLNRTFCNDTTFSFSFEIDF